MPRRSVTLGQAHAASLSLCTNQPAQLVRGRHCCSRQLSGFMIMRFHQMMTMRTIVKTASCNFGLRALPGVLDLGLTAIFEHAVPINLQQQERPVTSIMTRVVLLLAA